MRTRRLAWLCAGAIALITSGCGTAPAVSNGNDAVAADPGPASAVATPAASRPTPNMPGSTDILSVLSVEHQVDVAAERDGRVLSIARDEGNAVRAGDVLAQFDDSDLQMELIKARDDLRVSQNNLQYKAAELKAKTAALHRQQELRHYGLSSEADLEQAEFEAKGAEYDLHGWEALVQSGEAAVREIQIEVDRMRVHAPFPGVVVSRYIRQGDTVKKGDKCFRVSQLAPLEVRFQIPESSPRRPERGAPVTLSIISDPARQLKARIIKISPTIDPASDSYDVVALLTAGRHPGLLPGMAVRVQWPAASPASQP
ncbi:MAG: efflux RND transporter periplasmic adaptor subunit [Candidatus Acidiferrales bacterium]